jgi:dimethylhistidine N-methyltransferase
VTPAKVGHDHDIAAMQSAFAADVADGLTRQPKTLPPRYLYDDLGSALFNAICELPWYRVTRAETALIRAHGRAILSVFGDVGRLVELGAGNGVKLAALLAARPATLAALHVDLVDVSRAALESTERSLREMRGVSVACHEATYESGMERVARVPAGERRTLVLFLGSNIGNFDPPAADALLRHIRACLNPGDALLLGADLVKPAADLLLAYDDPLGVTAAFNRNLLVRINRELGADFDLSRYSHRAVWDGEHSRVEMHLVSSGAHVVRVPGAGIDVAVADGETIWTESSYKYRRADVNDMLDRAGFEVSAQFVDEHVAFALTLAAARPDVEATGERRG